MSEKTESIIISGLLHAEEFSRIALPHIHENYFESHAHKNLFRVILYHQEKYSKTPNKETMEIELSKLKITEEEYQKSSELCNKLTSDQAKKAVKNLSTDWLKDTTESYCLNRSVFLAIMDSIDIIDGKNKVKKQDAIPEILQQALAVCFDTNIGHDYLADWEERFEFYHKKENKIPTPLVCLNQVTKHGFTKKTLNMILAPTGVGKTHIKTYFSARYLMDGYNVLYITLEMAEELISERVDACLMDLTTDDLKKFPKQSFEKKITKIQSETAGKLIVKEFPTGSISVSNIRFLLEELRNKKDFVPDVLVVDYLNLLNSSRVKSAENTYKLVKSIAEELRGLAVEKNVMCLSSTQTNRTGQDVSDFGLTEVGESHGLSQTADFMVAAICTDEMERMNQMRFKILKNRYGRKDFSFMVGINREKMTLFDIDKIDTNAVSEPADKKLSSLVPNKQDEKFSSFKF